MARFDWFAWHRNYRTDEWIHSLSEAERWAWVAFLSYANETEWSIKKCSVTLLAPLLMVEPVTLSSMLESAISTGHILDNGVTLTVKNGKKYQPGKESNTNADRQARFKAIRGGYFVEDVSRFKVWEDANGACFHCGEHISFDNMELDHIIPVSKGGKHELSNVCCSCIKCNRSKSNTLSNSAQNKSNTLCQDKDNDKTRHTENTNVFSPDLPEPKSEPAAWMSDIVTQWNRMATELGYPKILRLTTERKKHLATRNKEPAFDFSAIVQAFRTHKPKILSGKNGSEWKPDFDYVIRSESCYTKILEGKFASNGDSNGHVKGYQAGNLSKERKFEF